ncbi:MAG TPA: isoquinoline 1-oxidoreductase [Actinobacteria bacterium]|nr:isoquinoline 1-oxidoreductase [Actinomycetota bacterium]
MATRGLLIVNGSPHELSLQPERTLLSVLRDELDLTGTKYGCGEGVCGACTVLLDGEPVHACRVAFEEAVGRSVTTVEGLATGAALHPVQQAFLEAGAMQCGFCTPGMIVRAVALLAVDPSPVDRRIVDAMSGNICRCCTYPRILRAVRRAAELAGESLGSDAAVPTPHVGAPAFAWSSRPDRPWDLSPPDERDYFRVLADGLVVVLPSDQVPAGAWSSGGGAWIHIGADGSVTAFTGKVDVGQDNRTALAMLVAEELAVPVESVRLVMGDTDVCPFDMGTFGSRSMADAGTALRMTAAAARDLLAAAAAERWGMRPAEAEAAGLVVEGGCVRDGSGERSIGHGELVSGQRRVEIVAQVGATVSSPENWRTAGTPTAKRTGYEVVTGARRYPSDLTRPGMLHGKVVRPPSFYATLRSADLAAARELPGVTVVDEDGFVGVAAGSPASARRALDAVHVEWDLPAPQPSEVDLVEHLRSHPVQAQGWDGAFHHETGDVDAALDAAPVRLGATYTTAYIAHVPLEPRAAVAEWDGQRLTVRTGTQRPFGVRSELAEALSVPEERIRVIVPDAGAGFGGKHSGEVAIEAARLSRAAGRPVKVRWTREEEFTWAYFRPAAVIDVESGAGPNGDLTAWAFTNVNAGSAGIMTPYEIPNQRIDHGAADSPLRQGSYRALAATANHFARESHMDEVAHHLGADPLEFRLRPLRDERLAAVFREAAERAGWAERSRGSGHGIGIAGGVEKDGRVATCAEVRVDDGSLEVVRIVTAFECGAIVNPDGLVNQIEGATVMGLGGALHEAVHFADGRILNASLSGYRVPRFTDVPLIEVVLLDRRDAPSAGAGEAPIVSVAPALANAIFDAVGVRIRSMPLVPGGLVASEPRSS